MIIILIESSCAMLSLSRPVRRVGGTQSILLGMNHQLHSLKCDAKGLRREGLRPKETILSEWTQRLKRQTSSEHPTVNVLLSNYPPIYLRQQIKLAPRGQKRNVSAYIFTCGSAIKRCTAPFDCRRREDKKTFICCLLSKGGLWQK